MPALEGVDLFCFLGSPGLDYFSITSLTDNIRILDIDIVPQVCKYEVLEIQLAYSSLFLILRKLLIRNDYRSMSHGQRRKKEV